MSWAALAAMLFANSASADGPYQLGHGYDLGPFNLAGYGNLIANIPDEGRKGLVVEDLSLFVSGHVTSLFNPFVEAEATGLNIAGSRASGDDPGKGSAVLERLYDDANLTDGLTLRVGKMLAPVGEWNQIHAAPLVLSTVRPAVTYRNFSEYVTGLSLLYVDPDSRLPDLQIYWQPAGEFAERPASLSEHQYRNVEGFHLSYPLSLLDHLGFSFQRANSRQGGTQSLFGVDFQYTLDRLVLRGEWTYTDISGAVPPSGTQKQWAGYAAASYALTPSWSVYSWYEGYLRRNAAPPAHDLLFGVAYRPEPAMVIKLEYIENLGGQRVNPTGLFASWSVLF